MQEVVSPVFVFATNHLKIGTIFDRMNRVLVVVVCLVFFFVFGCSCCFSWSIHTHEC